MRGLMRMRGVRSRMSLEAKYLVSSFRKVSSSVKGEWKYNVALEGKGHESLSQLIGNYFNASEIADKAIEIGLKDYSYRSRPDFESVGTSRAVRSRFSVQRDVPSPDFFAELEMIMLRSEEEINVH